jgi:coenzyme F420-reducing hydrogenase delta subunit/NAD-dependent dihydropyrimidine dehydrogenase PreA subunit
VNGKVCILGGNACAAEIAAHLVAADVGVILAAVDEPKAPGLPEAVEILSAARLAGIRGGPGRFLLDFVCGGRTLRREAAAVVLAEAGERRPAFERYGLAPGEAVIALSQLPAWEGRQPAAADLRRQVVFLNGLLAESHPREAGEAMRAALRLQAQGGTQSTILTRNLKVAGEGLEALAREARAAGVLFFKFARTTPEILQDAGGWVEIRFADELMDERWVLRPDLVVVEEDPRPSAYAAALGRRFEIESGAGGFQQADNVHRLPVATNRRGVVVAGECRTRGADPAVDAGDAALAVVDVLAALGAEPGPSAEIEAGRCIRCLTCLRICPYRAVAMQPLPVIQPEACERCGICVSECPRQAIRLDGLERGGLTATVAAGRPAATAAGPHIVAFCCRRSAGLAARQALASGAAWPAALTIVEVACAGSLAAEDLLATFTQGADGVLVLTCHEDNCHSREGNRFARSRAERAAEFITHCGGDGRRLRFETLAANMPAEFSRIVSDFSRSLCKAEPEPDKKGSL